MNVTTWICFWLAVIGIAEVIQAHKPPAEIRITNGTVTHETINAVIVGFLKKKAEEHKYDGFAWVYESVLDEWKKAGNDDTEGDDIT